MKQQRQAWKSILQPTALEIKQTGKARTNKCPMKVRATKQGTETAVQEWSASYYQLPRPTWGMWNSEVIFLHNKEEAVPNTKHCVLFTVLLSAVTLQGIQVSQATSKTKRGPPAQPLFPCTPNCMQETPAVASSQWPMAHGTQTPYCPEYQRSHILCGTITL